MPEAARKTVRLRVDEPTAEAYRRAAPDVRRQAAAKAADTLRLALMSGEELAEEFRRFTTATGADAEARGWTEEMNQALLRGDDGE